MIPDLPLDFCSFLFFQLYYLIYISIKLTIFYLTPSVPGSRPQTASGNIALAAPSRRDLVPAHHIT